MDRERVDSDSPVPAKNPAGAGAAGGARWSSVAVLRTTLIVVGVLAALYVVYLLRRPLGWLFIAAFIALALSPPVSYLSRRMRRGFAITIVYVGLLLLPIALGAAIVPPIVTQVQHLVDDAPRYARDVRDFIENNRTLRDLNTQYDIGGQLEKKAAELPAKFGSAASVLASVGLGVVNSVFALITILVLAAFMLAGGPRWRDGVLGMLSPPRAVACRRVSDKIAAAVGNYVGGALVQAVLAGTTSYLVMLILGIPFAGLLAVLVGVLDLIPLVGATIAAVIVGIVSVFSGFPVVTIVWAIWAIVYQLLENNVIQPKIQSRAVDVQPFVVLIAVLFGSTLFGVIGALMAVPLAASGQILIRELLPLRANARLANGAPDEGQQLSFDHQIDGDREDRARDGPADDQPGKSSLAEAGPA
jgi:predicted PurR-regulated permease PerM